MSGSLQSYWPPRRVEPGRAFALFNEAGGATRLTCPACRTPTVYTKPDGPAAWCVCDQCGWAGDHVRLAAAHLDVQPAEVPAIAVARGLALPKRCLDPRVLRGYAAHLAARAGAAGLTAAMRVRGVARHDADPFRGHGLTARPHNHPLWWCAHPGELVDALGRLDHTGAAAPAAVLDAVALVIPVTDDLGRLTGIEYRSGDGPWCFHAVRGEGATGVAFRPAATASLPAWGDLGVVTTNHVDALDWHAAQSRQAVAPAPVVSVHCAETAAVGRVNLPARPWVVWGSSPQALTVARGLAARVVVVHDARGDAVRNWPTTMAVMLRAAIPWQLGAAHAVHTRSDWGLPGFLTALGWSAALAAELAEHWPKDVMARARAAMSPLVRPAAVRLARGLSVEATAAGWLWVEQNEIVATVVPTVDRVYRDETRAVRYAGRVRLGPDDDLAFDVRAAQFRRDPFAVVETVLTRAGRHPPPAPHPAVIPHAAALIRYLDRLARRASPP